MTLTQRLNHTFRKTLFLIAFIFFLASTAFAASFTADLHPGMDHPEVLPLQVFLNQNGYPVALSGDGSKGMETTIMGPATVAALKRYQQAQGISQTGIVGEKTRVALNRAVASNPTPVVNTLKPAVTTPVYTPPTVTTQTTLFTVDLYPGQEHPQVKQLQQYLNRNGYTVATVGDGSTGLETMIMGPATVSALKRFQTAKGITQTGIVGELTRAALNRVTNTANPITYTPPVTTTRTLFTVDLYPGQEHPQIKALQQYLNQNGYTVAQSGDGSKGMETTIMGPATVAALKRFQAANNINQTGIVGELTRAALNRTTNTANPITYTPPVVTTPVAPVLTTNTPTITFTANPSTVKPKKTTKLTWKAPTATGCITPWGSTKNAGTYTTPKLATTTSYSISCTGLNGTAIASLTVLVKKSSGGGGGGGGGGSSTPTPPAPSGGATALTLTGPTSGLVSVPSSVFIVSANGTLSSSVTITPAATGGGSFSPNSVTLSSTITTATFTYTPASTGLKSISITNNRGLTNPSSRSYNATGAGASITTFTLTSDTTNVAAPFTLGHAFKQGDVPSGFSVVVSGADAQVTPKNYWPDGSLKFATIAGSASLTANTPRTITLTVGTPSTGTALTTADLVATGITANITAGAFGSASWSSADFATPFESWISGHKMSSFIYRKQIGTDAHLVGWLEVRLYAGGIVEVLPWVENGYLMVAGPTNKNATYTFTLGGTERFNRAIDLKHHQRTPLIFGSALSYWSTTDPNVIPRHDTAYLQATELVPTYRGRPAANDSKIIGGSSQPGLVTTYEPLQIGNLWFGRSGNNPENMAGGGYQPPIGILPEHDVFYITAPDSVGHITYGAVVRNGFSAGRYALHHRDETTNRPARFSDYQGLVFYDDNSFKDTGGGSYTTPATSGGNPPRWDTAHSPSVGYMAYLLTGRQFFLEETQFAANAQHFNITNASRGGQVWNGNGFSEILPGYTGASSIATTDVQLRSSAWHLRSLIQALAITPQTDILFAEYQNAVEDNATWHRAVYSQAPLNQFGLIQDKVNYGSLPGVQAGSIWMQDFVTAVWGYAKSLGLPISTSAQADMDHFFAWKAKSVIGRLGTSTEFWYVNAAPYAMANSPVSQPNYFAGLGATGPWYNNWREIYNATYINSLPWMSATEGVLTSEYWPESSTPSMFNNLQPAIAYAVQHEIPGAVEAYSRMIGATNWSAIVTTFNAHPVWSVAPVTEVVLTVPPPPVTPPSSSSTPEWLDVASVGEWSQIPNTIAPQEVGDFSGLALRDDSETIELFSGANGGHGGNLTNNRVRTLKLDTDVPVWIERRAASNATGWDTTGVTTPYFSDGRPAPRHTYFDMFWSPEINRYLVGGRFWGSGAIDWGSTYDAFNPDTNDWDPAGTVSKISSLMLSSRDPVTGIIYSMLGGTYNPATNQVSTWNLTGTSTLNRGSSAFDTNRREIYHLSSGDNFGGPGSTLVSTRVTLGGVKSEITFNNSAGRTQFELDFPTTMTAALTYDSDLDYYYYYFGSAAVGTQKIYRIKPNNTTVWDIDIIPVTGVTPAISFGGGVMNKFVYISRLKACVLVVGNQNVYFIRIQ